MARCALRSRVVQFPEDLLLRIAELFPDNRRFSDPAFQLSRRGALFSDACSQLCAPLLGDLMQAKGPQRASLFLQILANLAADADVQTLASDTYLPDPSGFMSAGVNKALAFINANLTDDFSEDDLAATAGMTAPCLLAQLPPAYRAWAWSNTSTACRINLACQMLMNEPETSVTDICFAVGFNNLSNFNRQFLRRKGMTPCRFRALL